MQPALDLTENRPWNGGRKMAKGHLKPHPYQADIMTVWSMHISSAKSIFLFWNAVQSLYRQVVLVVERAKSALISRTDASCVSNPRILFFDDLRKKSICVLAI